MLALPRYLPALAVLAMLALGLLQGCAVNPATGRPEVVFMSEDKELALGQQTHEQILRQMPIYNDPALTDYVNEVGQRLAARGDRPDLDYRFTIIDSPDVNAFALPGGYIYINRGLMAYMETEAQLAAVLGHEIAHVTARHAVRQHRNAVLANTAGLAVAIGTGVGAAGDLAGIAGQAAVSGYGRGLELEADRLGAEYMAQAGYDHEQMLRVLDILKYQQEYAQQRAQAQGREAGGYHGLFASHPRNDQRLQEVVRAASKLEAAADPVVGRDRFLQRIDGMVYGHNRDQGVIRGSGFYHAPLDIALGFPDDWLIENLPNAVVGFAPGGSAAIQMQSTQQPDATPAQLLRKSGIQGLNNLRELTVHNLPAAIGEAGNGGRVAAVYHADSAYVFIGQRKTLNETEFANAFERVVTSFHSLTSVEARKAEPWRIRLWQAKPGIDYEQLARISPLGQDAQAQLRLLNQDYPDGALQPGTRAKLVE